MTFKQSWTTFCWVVNLVTDIFLLCGAPPVVCVISGAFTLVFWFSWVTLELGIVHGEGGGWLEAKDDYHTPASAACMVFAAVYLMFICIPVLYVDVVCCVPLTIFWAAILYINRVVKQTRRLHDEM